MKKLVVLFGILAVALYISGCGDDKECACTMYYSGTGSENYETEHYTKYISDDLHCSDELNYTRTDDNGLIVTVSCVGVSD